MTNREWQEENAMMDEINANTDYLLPEVEKEKVSFGWSVTIGVIGTVLAMYGIAYLAVRYL